MEPSTATEIRLLVTGGRHQNHPALEALGRRLEEIDPDVIIHGDSGQTDWAADSWGRRKGKMVIAFPYPSGLGKSGGPRRNAWMIEEGRPTHGLALRGGKGTEDCIASLERKGIPVERLP